MAVPADSTGGSPVLLADGLFVGLLAPTVGSRFRRREGKLTVTSTSPVFVREGEPFESWSEYTELVLAGSARAGRTAPFHDAVEYCTWVEQKAAAVQNGTTPQAQLTDAFIMDFLDRIDAMDLPRGKVTIDDGWFTSDGPGGLGDWDVDTDRIADLATVARRIRERGHVPGLWFAPGRAAVASRFRTGRPEEFFPIVSARAETIGRATRERYAWPGADLLDHLRRTFARYSDQGFAKYKLDLHYGPKHIMIGQLQLAYAAIKALDPTYEVEHHTPDIFASRWADVVRTNDVLINNEQQWRGVAAAHWFISRWSCPDTLLNLDHIGGNDPTVGAADFSEHLDRMRSFDGYPVVSLLPDRFGAEVSSQVRTALVGYDTTRGRTWTAPEPISWHEFLGDRERTWR
ncbi:alpha-galactosidase [Jiangella alkaliphila]|nr:alpha-galactosidase [Jiangella alkaliphila]